MSYLSSIKEECHDPQDLTDEEFKWLIEQAEKVELLEDGINAAKAMLYDKDKRIKELEKQNKFMFNEIKRYLTIDLGYSDEEATSEIKKALDKS